MITPDGKVEINSQLVGKVNVYNILAAAAAAHARGLTLQQIAMEWQPSRTFPTLSAVSVGNHLRCRGLRDTDDALRNLTALAREFVSSDGRKNRVITVFGCGGDRDRAKRP